MLKVEQTWRDALIDEMKKPYFLHLKALIKEKRLAGVKVYPPEDMVFNAFKLTPLETVKVVIIGKIPTMVPDKPTGSPSASKKGIPIPPSLRNIYKELYDDLGVKPPNHGCLIPWAEQGVMLLNAVLTVEDGTPFVHGNLGWERFTDAAVKCLAELDRPLVFVLWGSHAIKKCEQILLSSNKQNHLILKSVHPSPLSASRGFMGCKHFSKINAFLRKNGIQEIDWQLT